MLKALGLQNFIIGIFIMTAIAALLVFSGFIDVGGKGSDAKGSVLVWGTLPYQTMQKYIEQTKNQNLSVTYQAQNPDTYESDLVNAIAAGRGPDLFIMSHEQILRNKDKIFEIPYSNLPLQDYNSRYIRESQVFLTETGELALPLTVDPIVMYYNKSLLNSAFIIDIPQYWDELVSLAPQLTEADANGRISISAVALGTFDNIESAKGIISSLLIQNSNPIDNIDPSSLKYRSTLALDENLFNQTKQALEFYVSFSQFGAQNYSWNEALANSKDMFVAGDLAIYFGRSSELLDIQKKNPNLDFDVALYPQLRENTDKSTFGYMKGIAISKQSKNVPAALAVASKISGPDIVEPLSVEINEVPARFDLLRSKPEEAYLGTFYNSAIIAKAWVDPEPSLTDQLFRNLIRNINSGALTIDESIQRTNTELNTILNDTINKTIVDKNLRDI